MARFDVYPNPTATERKHTPFVVDVQNNHLQPLETRIVIPLRTLRTFSKPAQNLNPVLTVQGQIVVLDTASLAPVPSMLLRQPVARADAESGDIVDALDTLFGSF
jgi:toxin CcdB